MPPQSRRGCRTTRHVCKSATSPHLEDIGLLAHPDAAADSRDVSAREQRADGQEVVAHVREAVAVVLLGVVVHQLEAQQRAQVAVGAAVPAAPGWEMPDLPDVQSSTPTQTAGCWTARSLWSHRHSLEAGNGCDQVHRDDFVLHSRQDAIPSLLHTTMHRAAMATGAAACRSLCVQALCAMHCCISNIMHVCSARSSAPSPPLSAPGSPPG